MQDKDITQLIERQRERHSLTREFYSDPDIYERDIERIFLRSWLYAGHQSEIPEPGDWMLFDFAGESVIVARSPEGGINALLNVCRHRGSRICVENTGCSKRLICRYHGWTYDLDGRLVGASRMHEDFDKTGIALKRIHVELLDGMIFVNFADNPTPFNPVREGLAECLRAYDLGNAKVAHRQNYPIAANWKLAVENYTECYHCGPAHPEYSRGHSLAHHGVRSGPLFDEMMAKAGACGLSVESVNRMYQDAPGFGADYGYDRYPLIGDHLTGSEDGRPLAPVLGSSLLSAASLLTGVFVVEIVFNIRGISTVAVRSMAFVPDAPAAMGFAIYSVIVVLALMGILDLLQSIFDPRIREQG